MYLAVNEFKSVMAPNLVLKKILPVEVPEDDDAKQIDYIYEQPPQELLGELLPRYVEMSIYRAMLESNFGGTCGAHDGHGHGDFECRRRDPDADVEYEPGAASQPSRAKLSRLSAARPRCKRSSLWQKAVAEGRVVQVAGPTIEIQFPEGHIPKI